MIQDLIEETLIKEGFFAAAKDFIVHRVTATSDLHEEHSTSAASSPNERLFTIAKREGGVVTVPESALRKTISFACRGLEKTTNSELLLEESVRNFYEGIKEQEVDLSHIMAARAKIEWEPDYSKVASRLLLDLLYRETMLVNADHPKLVHHHREYFKKYIQKGIQIERLSPALLDFDLDRLGKTMRLDRDDLFGYLGLQTLYDRYFIHQEERRLRRPKFSGCALQWVLQSEKKTKTAVRSSFTKFSPFPLCLEHPYPLQFRNYPLSAQLLLPLDGRRRSAPYL